MGKGQILIIGNDMEFYHLFQDRIAQADIGICTVNWPMETLFFGCLVFNAAYPTGSAVTLPEQAEVKRILKEIRILAEKTYGKGVSGHKRLGKLVAWCSRYIITKLERTEAAVQNRVAPWDHNNTRAYFSLCRNCNHLHKDCQVGYIGACAKKIFPGSAARAGPGQSFGGLEYGTYQGIPLW